MTMDLLLHEVLRTIKAGVASFFPDSNSDSDSDKFQAIAKTIVFAHQQGYIVRVHPCMDTSSGQRRYCQVLIDGGLTYEGECLLKDYSGQPTPADETLTELLNSVPSNNIRDKWKKALYRRMEDPSGAITAARSLLETTLKWIIEQRGGVATENNKELFNNVINILEINSQGKSVEKIIEGLNSIFWGIGDMRNKHGDAHGTTSSTTPTVTEAGLCVNLAGAAALYLLEVFEAGNKVN